MDIVDTGPVKERVVAGKVPTGPCAHRDVMSPRCLNVGVAKAMTLSHLREL